MFVGMVAAACQDLPTSTPEAGLIPQPNGHAGAMTASSHCFLNRPSVSGSAPYRGSTVRIRFPEHARSRDGATRLLRFRVVDPTDGRSLGMGSCTIPDTDVAEEMVLSHLNLVERKPTDPGGPGGPRFSAGCVTSGTCMLEGVTVTVPGSTWGFNGGTTGNGYSWGGTSGGGGGWDGFDASAGVGHDAWTEDPGPDGSYRPSCDRDTSGFCVTRTPSSEEWDLLGQRINALRTTTAECASARQILQNLHAQGPQAGRLRLWDGYDVYYDAERQRWMQRYGQNLSDAQGRFLEYDSKWVFDDPTVLVHEALHYYLDQIGSTLQGDDNEDWVRSKQGSCV
jgi:hypothetical protein